MVMVSSCARRFMRNGGHRPFRQRYRECHGRIGVDQFLVPEGVRNASETKVDHTGTWPAGGDGGGLRAARTTAVASAVRRARPRWWPAGLAWALWALAMLGLVAVFWMEVLLRRAGRA